MCVISFFLPVFPLFFSLHGHSVTHLALPFHISPRVFRISPRVTRFTTSWVAKNVCVCVFGFPFPFFSLHPARPTTS